MKISVCRALLVMVAIAMVCPAVSSAYSVVFWDESGVYASELDGAGAVPIHNLGLLTPDGESVIATKWTAPAYTTSIVAEDIGTGAERTLVESVPGFDIDLTDIGADNRTIYYTQSQGPSTDSDVFAVDMSGRNRRVIVTSPDPELNYSANFNGQWGAFLRTHPGTGNVFFFYTLHVRRPDGTTSQIDLSSLDAQPEILDAEISPDGGTIAFSLRAMGDHSKDGLYLVNTDGTNLHRILYRPGYRLERLSWAPGGDTLMLSFYEGTYGTSEVYTIKPDGTGFFRKEGLGSAASFRRTGIAAPWFLRPTLRFDDSERYRPLDVDAFLAEPPTFDRMNQLCGTDTDDDTGETFNWCGQLHPESLKYGDYIDIAGDGNADNYFSPYEGCTLGDLRDCDSGPLSAMYYWETPANGDHGYYVDYWMFYRYNDWPGLFGGDHEGDWESVTVARSAVSGEGFDFASFSQHGHWYSYLRDNLSCDGGPAGSCGDATNLIPGHLTTYVANGSHANYPDPCDKDGNDCNVRTDLGGEIVGDGGHDGHQRWGNDTDHAALIPLPSPADPDSWAAFDGPWGAHGSPRGPAFGGNGAHLNAPWISDCADGNSGCAQTARATQRRATLAARVRGNARCDAWFGSDVVAATCTPRIIRAALTHQAVSGPGALKLSLPRAHGQTRPTGASAPGIAQALGAPLAPGRSITLRGHAPRGTVVLVRATSRTQLVEAQFRLTERMSGRARIVAEQRDGRLQLVLKARGQRVIPQRISRTRLRIRQQPSIDASVHTAHRITFDLTAPTRRVQVGFLERRRGDAFGERTLVAPANQRRRVSLRIPKDARMLVLVATTRRGAQSRPLYVRLDRVDP